MKRLSSRRSMGVAGMVLLLASLLVAMGLPAAAAPGDPPGNNGTIKIDGQEFDSHPDNEPHVGCLFQVDFYGYDEGDLWADLAFDVQPPTGPFEQVLADAVFIGEDPAGGGTDLDASKTYDLSGLLAAYEPHPQQGWHVKLTVNAQGSIGADVKHKVFWVSVCVPPTTTTTTSTTTTQPTTTTTSTTTTQPTTTSTTETTQPTTTSSTVTTQPTTASTAPAVSVAGIQVSLPEAAQVSTGGTLPFTGLSTPSLAVLASALAAAGVLLLASTRRGVEPEAARNWS